MTLTSSLLASAVRWRRNLMSTSGWAPSQRFSRSKRVYKRTKATLWATRPQFPEIAHKRIRRSKPMTLRCHYFLGNLRIIRSFKVIQLISKKKMISFWRWFLRRSRSMRTLLLLSKNLRMKIWGRWPQISRKEATSLRN